MPQERYYRTWCKKCKDWELHYREFSMPNKLICKTCDTIFTIALLKDIPIEKVKEQRERYSKMNVNHMRGFMTGMHLGMGADMVNVFSETNEEGAVITECDAGQVAEDRRKREALEKKREEQRIVRASQRAEMAKYSHLGRNDICICGSGKKYKKCCLIKIQSYG